MSRLHRTCTECGRQLQGKQQFTCSGNCRTARSLRIKRQRRRKPVEVPDGIAAFEALDKMDEVARDVMQAELAPIVREAITEDTMRGIQKLVALTGTMVEALGRDLEDPDPAVRQKAYTLGLRYTVGHGALIAPDQKDAGQQINVIFEGMPRPDSQDSSAEEDRECQDCHQVKPQSQFVAHSDRCQPCFDAITAKAQAFLDD